MKVFLNLTVKTLFYLGFFLFIINIIGLFISLRNESIYQEKNTSFANDIILTEKEFYDRINKAVIDKKEYITNLNEAVNQGIAKYWRNAGINKYNLRIPFYENYLLFIASYLNPEEYLNMSLLIIGKRLNVELACVHSRPSSYLKFYGNKVFLHLLSVYPVM